MHDTEIKSNVEQFSREWQKVMMLYSDYARSVGINYTTLQVLKYIAEIDNCTQKIICEQSFLPKQTVNSIITSLYKDDYVELRELAEDRRAKSIHLTKSGKQYSDMISERLYKAEYQAMENMTAEKRKNLLDSFHEYAELFQSQLFHNR